MMSLPGAIVVARFATAEESAEHFFVALAFAVTACGVKNDLVKPNGQTTTKDEHDPSKPPYPLGR